MAQDKVNIRVCALFVRFGEECSNIAQEIASVIETRAKFWLFRNCLILQGLWNGNCKHSSNPLVPFNFFVISKDLTEHAPGTMLYLPA